VIVIAFNYLNFTPLWGVVSIGTVLGERNLLSSCIADFYTDNSRYRRVLWSNLSTLVYAASRAVKLKAHMPLQLLLLNSRGWVVQLFLIQPRSHAGLGMVSSVQLGIFKACKMTEYQIPFYYSTDYPSVG
jgi:hypothetical protein